MSLTTCPKCDKVVAKKSNVCHNCGHLLDQEEISGAGEKILMITYSHFVLVFSYF